MSSILRRLFFMLVLLIPLTLSAQENKPNKVQKKADKKKELRVENQKNSELKGRKRHLALQTKEVRKRMKRHNRQVNAQKSHKKKGFFYRIFHRNEH